MKLEVCSFELAAANMEDDIKEMAVKFNEITRIGNLTIKQSK